VLARTLAEPATGHDLVASLRTYERRRRDRTRSMVAESRRMSDLEQAARPVRRLVRNGSFRLTPRRILTRRIAQALVFQDGPAAEPSNVQREPSSRTQVTVPAPPLPERP
ncbi:hypothetical protein ACFW0I_38035, partial [[Kitasatospora] papulosa]